MNERSWSGSSVQPVHGPSSGSLNAIKTAVALGRVVPPPVRRMVIAELIAQALRQTLADGDLDVLKNRVVLIEISDVKIGWPLTLVANQLVLLRGTPQVDVTIRGKLWEFMLLATRRCDPDTLFFDRRLSIEGDTELGLAVKNALDALDDDQLPMPLRYGMRVGARLVDHLI